MMVERPRTAFILLFLAATKLLHGTPLCGGGRVLALCKAPVPGFNTVDSEWSLFNLDAVLPSVKYSVQRCASHGFWKRQGFGRL